MPDLKKILRKIVKILQKAKKENDLFSYSLIGGFAVSARALPRSTKDIDFLIDALPSFYSEDLPKLLQGSTFHYKMFQAGFSDPLNGLIRIYDKEDNEIVDLIPVFWKWHKDVIRFSEEVELEDGVKVPIARTEDLIVLKLKAAGPQDLLDVKSLLLSSKASGSLDNSRLKELAKKARVDKKLATFENLFPQK